MKDTGPNRDRTMQTPGPWTTWQDPFDTTWRIDHKIPNNTVIVGMVADEGDARLVAAAPDLLAMCRAVLPLLDGEHDGSQQYEDLRGHTADQIREVIAKAAGK